MGNFLIESEIIIKKHIACCNINSKEEYLNKWIEFIDIHLQNPVIHFKVFLDILNNLVKSLTEGELSDYEVKSIFPHQYSKQYILKIYFT